MLPIRFDYYSQGAIFVTNGKSHLNSPHPMRAMTACRNKLAPMIVFRFHFFSFFFSESHEKVSLPNIWLNQMRSRRLHISEQLALIGGW